MLLAAKKVCRQGSERHACNKLGRMQVTYILTRARGGPLSSTSSKGVRNACQRDLDSGL